MDERGELCAPLPSVIATSQWKSVALLAVCLGFVGIGVWALFTNGRSLEMVGVVGFFGLGVLVLGYTVLSPPRLELTPEGLTWFTGFKSVTFKWSDFAEFHAYSPAPGTAHVGFSYAQNSPHLGKAGKALGAIAGLHGGLGGGWQRGTPYVVRVLNDAIVQWGGAAPPDISSVGD